MESAAIRLDLTIRKTEEGWEAEVYSDDGWSVGVLGGTPQRAVLRLALALIMLPRQASRLERLLGYRLLIVG